MSFNSYRAWLRRKLFLTCAALGLRGTARLLEEVGVADVGHKVGWHLGNMVPISKGGWGIIEAVPPSAVLFITGEFVTSDDLRRILDISPGCHIFYRPYFAPSDNVMNYQGYIEAVRSMIDDSNRGYWEFVPEGQRHLQIFNEPNMPRRSQWEGFGSTEEDMERFDDWFCKGYNLLKKTNPTFRIGFTPLTPGNRDVYFKGDTTHVPYYMHGPEAAKPDATRAEIMLSITTGPCRNALSIADEYLAHIYVMNDVPNQMREAWGGLRFLQYAKFLPKPMDIWITELGIGGDAQNWAEWYKLLGLYPVVKGTCIWRLEYEIRSPTDPAVQVLKEYVENAPEPEPPVDDIEGTLRDAAWNAAGIAYNPDAAFPIYARGHGLGAPMCGEVDVAVAGITYRIQGFVGAIVYAKVGDWANIKHIDW